MLRHNLLLFYRNIKRYKGSFFINLIGLSTGLACALLIFLWVQDERSVDAFHENSSRLFRVMENAKKDNSIITSVESAGPVAEALAKEIPEIESAVAVAPAGWFGKFTLSTGNDNNVRAAGQHVGKDYFNMFSFPLLHGDKQRVLEDKTSIVISDELALRLFNTTGNIVGKTVDFQHQKQFIVSGVFKKMPANSTEQFDFALSFEEMKDTHSWVKNWGNTGPHIFVQVKPGTNIDQLNQKIAGFIQSHDGDSTRTLFVTPFSQNYLYGKYENGVQVGGRIEYVRLFSIIAFFILVIACINFMNLSTAKASRRVKEVGIKKAIGGSRKQLIFQYLGESLLMTFVSLITAVMLVLLFLPQYNQITGKQLHVPFDAPFIGNLLLIGLFTGLLAGSYPALYLSAFNPIVILKGKIRNSIGEVLARKGLVVFQFMLSVVLIISVVVVYKQITFVQTKNPGYNKDNVVYFDIEGTVATNTPTFLSQIKAIPGVVNASSTSHDMVAHNYADPGFSWPGKNEKDWIFFQGVRGNYDLIETLGVAMKEGRSFSRNYGADSHAVVLNEAAVALIGLKDPVGKTIKYWGDDRQIIGVVKDFHFESLHEAVKPLYFSLQPEHAKYIMAKIEGGKERQTLVQLEAFYRKYNPGFTLNYTFLDSEYQAQYASEQRVAVLSQYFAGLAILISCLGLFGLAAFMAERRQKEIGVRKVLGATVSQIVLLLSREFMQLVLIAILIAVPLALWATNKWLQDFAYKAEIGWWLFALAALAAVLIALLTVSFQSLKAAVANPVKSLRTE
jgi:predicted permease